MDIRGKTITIVVSAFFCVTSAFLGLAHIFYARGADTLAEQEAAEAFGRVFALAQDDLDQLALLATDWGVWDDTYQYVETRDPDYEESNLYEQALLSIQLAYFGIYDAEDELVVSRDLAAGMDRNVPAIVPSRDIGPGSSLYEQAEAEGLATAVMVTSAGMQLACARSILRSDGSGPTAGIIIMTRALNGARVARWARLTGTVVSVVEMKGQRLSLPVTIDRTKSGTREARGPLPRASKRIGDNETADYVEVVASSQRPHRGFGDRLLLGMLLMLTLVSLAIGGATVFLISRLVLRRLSVLGRDMELIAASGAPTLRVHISGRDELARFGEIINRTLDALERSFLESERARRLLAASLQEREAMFREIRHRVKNNLQVVASLLNLQADESGGATAAALYESRRRVLAMAFVHEELYSSESLDHINLGEYLSRLSVSVRTGAGEEERIRFASDLDQITLEIDRAVPFGLIANEVLTNAYVHAFPPAKCHVGTITMSLKRESEREAVFSVIDDGIGIPAEPGSGSKLGLTLINTLANQLGAKVEFARRSSGGTSFSMTFSLCEARTPK